MEMDLEVLVNGKLNICQQCTLRAKWPQNITGCWPETLSTEKHDVSPS